MRMGKARGEMLRVFVHEKLNAFVLLPRGQPSSKGYPLGLPPRGLKRKHGFLLRISFRKPQSGALQHRRLRTSDCQSKSDEFEWFIFALV